ncbi:MAG: hypothetical protein IJ642_05160 [Oscillospiraceae bacterium]|nr:hypothetical protein [Oscillospiraceae bacterium]
MKNYQTITFGTYAGKPVEWLVLHEEREKMLVLSKYILDAKRMFPDCIYIDWERSTLRKWLNHDFFQLTFSPEEQQKIVTGNLASQDKLFLLSEEEINSYLPDLSSRTAPAEPNAVGYSQDLKDFVNLLPFYQERKNCWWWLRSNGDEPNTFCIVWSDGSVSGTGHYANYERGIRPAMYLNLKLSK